jgi:hypothetical protein
MITTKHKSGQATIVIVVVTMITVLGVAVASSSQSRINLRDTVYSTQTLQALSCAEAGVDRALVSDGIQQEEPLAVNGSLDPLDSSSDSAYAIEGCDGYHVDIRRYPWRNDVPVTVPNLPENAVQEFRTGSFSDEDKAIKFLPTEENSNVAIAVYDYYVDGGEEKVDRQMVFCNVNGSFDPSSAPEDFIEINTDPTETIILEDDEGTEIPNVCSYPFRRHNGSVAMRVRPLYSDIVLQVDDYEGQAGYQIISDGTSGEVERNVVVIRFLSQLSGAFDEAIVAGGDIVDE